MEATTRIELVYTVLRADLFIDTQFRARIEKPVQ
jgi:hypothetical protein